MFDTREVAARVHDFAVLTLRGVDTTTATNFDKGAYLGADGALLPVEAALPGLGRDEHRPVRDKLAAMMAPEAMLPQPHKQLPQAPPKRQVLAQLRQLPLAGRGGMPNRQQQQQQEEAASEEPSIKQAIGLQAEEAAVKAEVQPEAHEAPPPHQPLPQPQPQPQPQPPAPQAHEAPLSVAPPHDIHARAAAARVALAFLCDLTAAFDKGVLSEEEFKAMRAQSMADMRM
jgi:hypothetical protein